MIYDVLLTKSSDKRYIARALLLPDIVVSGTDEAEALQKLRTAIAEVQANSRIVQVDVPSSGDTASDTWLRFAGIWERDPDWDVFQSMVAHYEQTATEREVWQAGDFVDEN
jgi:predicted RNase H-like HicB family nuclease